MVYKITSKLNLNPIISYLDECIHDDYEFEGGKLLLENNNSITITNDTRFEIIDDSYIKLINPVYGNAIVKISSIIGVVK